MSMNAEALEARLGTLDLQLAPRGHHLDEQQLATIAEGGEPDRLEAEHLAGCDDCVEVLVLLGEGLADVARLRNPAPTPIRPAPPRKWAVVLAAVVIGGAAMAAFSWVAVQGRKAVAPAAPLELPADPVRRSVPAPEAAPAPVPVPELPPEALIQPPPPEPAPAPEKATQVTRPAPKPARPETRLRDRAQQQVTAVGGPPQRDGKLQITSQPRAQVFIDGEPRGWTPLVDLRLPEGPHDVRLVYNPDLAERPEERFRVVIEPDVTRQVLRKNIKK